MDGEGRILRKRNAGQQRRCKNTLRNAGERPKDGKKRVNTARTLLQRTGSSGKLLRHVIVDGGQTTLSGLTVRDDAFRHEQSTLRAHEQFLVLTPTGLGNAYLISIFPLTAWGPNIPFSHPLYLPTLAR